jgi:pyruvate dehydrogenase E1 component
LRRDGLAAERWNTLHPEEDPRQPWVKRCLGGREGPVIATSDYMRSFADQIRAWVPGTYRVLGTDGYGRSDYRVALRDFFEVDRRHVVVTALKALADDGAIEAATVSDAIKRYELHPEREAPWLR